MRRSGEVRLTPQVLRRRLSILEIPLLVAAFLLFFQITDYKDIGYAVGVVGGIGILALTFFRPKWGLIAALGIAFLESTINVINQLAESAVENDLTGMPSLVQTIWFSWGVQIIYITLLLSYYARSFVKGRKITALTGLEMVLLMPLFAALTYFPISMLMGNDAFDYRMDILPMCILGGIVILARSMMIEKDPDESRYWFLDWFIIINILILIPLWGYNLAFEPWRNGYVGIAAVRYGTGPYDFNFFLVPLLGMLLTYDDNLSLKRRRFYQFAFFLSLARIVVSMFRGAIGGTLIALVIATFLVEKARRWRWVRSLLIFVGAVLILGALVIATVPVARTTFNVALVKRVNQALNSGAGGTSLQFRELETQQAMDQIAEEPIFGYGPGSFITKHFNPRKFARKEMYLHSAYVWYWYKMGILGIGVLVAFFSGIYLTCFQLLKRKLLPMDRGWVIGTLAGTIAMLPVIHTNNMLIRSQGAYGLTLILFGLVMIALKYRGIPKDQLPTAGLKDLIKEEATA